MIFVVLEDSRCSIFTESIVKKFPTSSIVKINKSSKIVNLKFLESKPLLTNKWLVFIDNNVDDLTLKFVGSKEHCICIYYTTSVGCKRDYSKCRSINTESEFIDNLNIGKDKSIDFIQNQINISKEDAEYLYNRCNKFLPYISESVNTLKVLGEYITRTHIQNYTSKHLNVTPNTLFYNLIDLKFTDRKIITEYLYTYRYAFDYLYKSLNSLFNSSLKLYKDIENGELSVDNVDNYYNKHSTLSVSLYFVKTILIDVYPNLTYGDLCIKRITMKKVNSILDLLSLF